MRVCGRAWGSRAAAERCTRLRRRKKLDAFFRLLCQPQYVQIHMWPVFRDFLGLTLHCPSDRLPGFFIGVSGYLRCGRAAGRVPAAAAEAAGPAGT